MGMVHAEITLKNVRDELFARDGYIKAEEIRNVTVTALVDTGAATLVINEAVRQMLGLAIDGARRARLADGTLRNYAMTEPVSVHWKNRKMTCQPLVLPNSNNVLLGAVPLEDMDLIVNPSTQELVGAHGEEIISIICQAFVQLCSHK